MSGSPVRYRWLCLGDHVRYVGRANPDLRGQLGQVAILPRPDSGRRNVLVQFGNGEMVVVPFGTLRKADGLDT